MTGRKNRATAEIDTFIKKVCNHFYLQSERCAAFETLVDCLRSRTRLLHPSGGEGGPGWVAPVFLLNRLKNLAERRGQWLRSFWDWQPTGKSLRLEFRSLALHLLGLYPVPGFMDSVWDLPAGPEAFRQQSWFIRLARGASFRELNLPTPLTRKMEHYTRQAPDHYTVAQALRYGETLALGGSGKLAREIAIGRLGQRVEHAEFWRSVILFFVNHQEMELALVQPIIDFIQANKFAGEPIMTARGWDHRQAPWPDFSIKGRTPASMRRLVQQWSAELNAKKPSQFFSWRPSPIQGFRFVENCNPAEGDREWTIGELVTSADLYVEGRSLGHCVYIYASKCRRGQATIWSLRLRVNGQEKRMATIEVDPSKGEIIQTRARCNHPVGIRSREIIEQWAQSAGLRVNPGSW